MDSKLIIIRGNSGSGKTTTAQLLQKQFDYEQAMLISQDTVRINILNAKDRPGNPTIELVKLMAEFGKDKYDYIIIEGIFASVRYKELFDGLMDLFAPYAYVYYYELPFEETVIRHQTRDKVNDFGPDRMKKWWLEKDYLNTMNETIIDESFSQEEVLKLILDDLTKD